MNPFANNRLPLVSSIMLLAAFAACPVAPAQQEGAKAEPEAAADLYQVYDLRDLRAIIPAPDSDDDAQQSATRRLIGELTSAIGAPFSAIADDVYIVGGPAETHSQLTALLNSVRDLYQERYELTLITYFVPAAAAIQLGDDAKPDAASTRRSIVATRRTPIRAGMETRHTYVVGVMPTVAQQAVGYQPIIQSLQSGLRLTALVGAGPEDEKGTSFMIGGEWSTVTQGRTFAVESTSGSPSYRMEFPQVESQLVHGDLRIEYRKLTVVAILGSPREGESTVIAAMVRKLAK